MRATALALVAGFLLAGSPALAADPPGPVITLVSPGKDPKKPLRFTAKKGMKKSLTTTMEMSVGMTMGTTAVPPQKVPPIQVVVDMKITDVSPTGDIRYTFVLKKPTILADKSTAPAVLAAMKDAVKGMTGLKGYAVVTNRGFTKEADITVPATANAQTKQLADGLKQSIHQIAAPVPEEPVGVGAKWKTVSKLDQNGMSLEQTATNELVSLDAKGAKLSIQIDQTAAPQKITTNGMTVDLKSYAASGKGETLLDLAGFVPKTANVSLKSDMKMESMGQSIAMTLEMAMTMKAK